MNYTPGRPTTFGKDQQVYTWNGTQHCVHCHKITEKGKCPLECDYWVGLGFDLTNGTGPCKDCGQEIRLGAPKNSANGVIHPQADSFTIFGLLTTDGLKGEVACDSCSSIRLDRDIAEGKFKYDPEADSWYSPDLFPETDPAYQAIEAAIEAGEAFQCTYCGLTDSIDQLDSLAGGFCCKICAEKHEATTYEPEAAQPTAFDEPSESAEPQAWHTYRIWDNGIGQQVQVHEATNDDLDTGHPSLDAAWSARFDNLENALAHTGKSRQGISCKVEVYLNGKKI